MQSRAHPEPICRVPTTWYGAFLLSCRRESNDGGAIPLDRAWASQAGLASLSTFDPWENTGQGDRLRSLSAWKFWVNWLTGGFMCDQPLLFRTVQGSVSACMPACMPVYACTHVHASVSYCCSRRVGTLSWASTETKQNSKWFQEW